ncbi:MAG: IPT/TIG domain-containing protein [Bryobacteraceae bacterium]
MTLKMTVGCLVALGVQAMFAQSGVLGTNLIQNGGAEDGPAGTGPANVVGSIPHWTRTGGATVLPYDLTTYLKSSDPAPPSPAEIAPSRPNRGFQYFMTCTSGSATLTQVIDVSAESAAIDARTVKYLASAYLGKVGSSDYNGSGQMAIAFQNAGGQTIITTIVGPNPTGTFGPRAQYLYYQEKSGLAPIGTAKIVVTLTLVSFNGGCGGADNLSLVLSMAGSLTAIDKELVVNGDAEMGTNIDHTQVVSDIPGWSRSGGGSVAPYGGTGWLAVSSPGPPVRGTNVFCGGGTIYQDVDLSGASQPIDAGQVSYEISAWMGGWKTSTSPTLTYQFFNWEGTQVGPTGTLGPTSHSTAGLAPSDHSDALPAHTRLVRITVTFPGNNYAADNISFKLTVPNGPPTIAGIVSASDFGALPALAAGSWIEIYGANLSKTTRSWTDGDIVNGNAPVSLDGVSVSIGGVTAFLDYVSPGQLVALVPSRVPTGVSVPVTVTNSNGTSLAFPMVVNAVEPGLLAPSLFKIGGKQYAAALFSDGHTFALPANAIPGVPSRPARSGETITLYGIGFGPVDRGYTAGTIVPGLNTLSNSLTFEFGTAQEVTPAYYGLAPAAFGLYQFNVVVPNVGANSLLPLSFRLGDAAGSQSLFIAVGE